MSGIPVPVARPTNGTGQAGRSLLIIALLGLSTVWLASDGKGQSQTPAPVAETALLVSVKAFGAVGDGRQDDRAAIVRAIQSGHAVFFPRGIYRIAAPIDFGALHDSDGWKQSSVMLIGEGPGISQLLFTGAGTMLVGGRTAPAAGGYEQRLAVRDLSFRGTPPASAKPQRRFGLFRTTPNEFAGTSSTQNAIYWEFEGSSMIEKSDFAGFDVAVATKAGYGLTVRNSAFRYNGIALRLSEAVTSSMVEKNIIERNDIGIAIWIASQIRIDNNVLQGNYGGADIVSYNWNTRISIVENYFEASPVGLFHAGDSVGEYISNNYFVSRNKGLSVKLGPLAQSFRFEDNRLEAFECTDAAHDIVMTRNTDDRADGLRPFTSLVGPGASTMCMSDDMAPRS